MADVFVFLAHILERDARTVCAQHTRNIRASRTRAHILLSIYPHLRKIKTAVSTAAFIIVLLYFSTPHTAQGP